MVRQPISPLIFNSALQVHKAAVKLRDIFEKKMIDLETKLANPSPQVSAGLCASVAEKGPP